MAVAAERAGSIAPTDRVQRHAGIDRLFHWLTAASVLTLMATGLLPHVGVHFDWLPIHWITGLALVVLVVFHLLRTLFWQQWRVIWFTAAQAASGYAGKYSVAQKLMHHAMGLVVLGAVVTGVLMLKKIQTPFLLRDPYIFSGVTWGWIYVIHGLAAVVAVTLVMIHVYFALIPENRMYLRAMVLGWVTRQELRSRLGASRTERSSG
jgi:cytochrome b subunit of formate dehydrogenase